MNKKKIIIASLFMFGLSTVNSFSFEDKTLNLKQNNTGDILKITFEKNGKVDLDAINKLDWFLRDWRKDKERKMDRRIFDALWDVQKAIGLDTVIYVHCGYRSAETNAMLRSRSSAVAEHSQHILGKAVDFSVPTMNVKKLREILLKLQHGGVGYYPSAGMPFVHMDVGNIRYWPRMTRVELARVFPDGKTLYLPTDGRPMPGYMEALNEQRNKDVNNNIQVASSEKEKSGTIFDLIFGNKKKSEDNIIVADNNVNIKQNNNVVPLPMERYYNFEKIPKENVRLADILDKYLEKNNKMYIANAVDAVNYMAGDIVNNKNGIALALGYGSDNERQINLPPIPISAPKVKNIELKSLSDLSLNDNKLYYPDIMHSFSLLMNNEKNGYNVFSDNFNVIKNENIDYKIIKIQKNDLELFSDISYIKKEEIERF